MKKNSISRPHIYLLILALFLLLFVFVFSFNFLIPKGKEYRQLRGELKVEKKKLRQYQDFNNAKLAILEDLQSKNRAIINSFNNGFNAEKFETKYKKYFSHLALSPQVKLADEEEFTIYEVNTTSQINSPKSFYNFLDAINKSDWIISIDFPIKFKRKEQGISSSFTMKVYKIDKKSDRNSTEKKIILPE